MGWSLFTQNGDSEPYTSRQKWICGVILILNFPENFPAHARRVHAQLSLQWLAEILICHCSFAQAL